MITIIITSYNEPKATERAVNIFLKQKSKEEFKIILVDPFSEVEKYIKKNIKTKNIEFFLDPGEGKSYALNLLLEMTYSNNKDDILVFTDGDVFVSGNAIEETMKAFKDKKIGCIIGKPVSIDERSTRYLFWADVAFKGIDRVRKRFSKERKFFECSGYFFAIRNGVIKEFPLDASEDSIIPYLFWKKGYKIYYADKIEVYVKNPNNWKDYISQKIRNVKGHENLNKIAPDMPRTKSLSNEIRYGAFFVLSQIRSVKEFFWAVEFYFVRLYIYIKAFRELKQHKEYSDGWRETEIKSAKPLD